MRYELSDYEWIAIKAMLSNKPRGMRRALRGSRLVSTSASVTRAAGSCRRAGERSLIAPKPWLKWWVTPSANPPY